MNQRLFVTGVLVFGFTTALAAQQSQTGRPAQQSQTPLPSPTPAAPPVRDTSDQDVVRITTNLVQVDVVVTKEGKQLTDLKPEDFEIFEDERRQTITSFAYVSTSGRVRHTTSSGSLIARSPNEVSDAPVAAKPITAEQVGRTMAIVVDDLGMSFDAVARTRTQLTKFINENLSSTDLVAIIRTGGDVGALQQFTTDRNVLQNAVTQLKWNPCSRVGLVVLPPARSTGGPNSPLCMMNAGPGDTIKSLRFILRGMSELPGRKSMVVISDSLPVEHQQISIEDPTLSRTKIGKREVNTNLPVSDLDGLSRLAEIAIRSSVVIYTVASQGLQTVGPHPSDEISHPPLGTRTTPDRDVITRLVLDRSRTLRLNTEGADLLARQTGGFMIKNTNEFGFEKVLEDQGGYYLIGYRPAATTFDRRFHEIKAKVKRGGLSVRTRAGFYGVTQPDTSGPPSTLSERMGQAVASPFGASGINVRLTPLFVDDPNRGPMLRIFVALDANDLTFIEEADKSNAAHLALSTVFFGENGSVVRQHDHSATLRLRGEPFERAKKEPLIYSFDVPAKDAGKFQFRIVVADTSSSRIGSAGQFLTIPDLKNGPALSGILLQPDQNSSTRSNEDLFVAAALRSFRQGTSLLFGYSIYNATADAVRSSRLTSQLVIFRDGRRIFTFTPSPVNTKNQTDLKRITAGGRLELGPEMTPGEYVLAVVVEDQSAKRSVTQWIQFEVIR